MSESIRATLHNAQQGRAEFAAAYEYAKPRLMAGQRLILEVKEATRSSEANALLHAMLKHISKYQTWAGKKHDLDTWKRLLTAAWCRARGEQIELLPALDGHGVDIVFRRTSSLTRKECAELIEFVYAWGAENDVRFPADPRQIAAPKYTEEMA